MNNYLEDATLMQCFRFQIIKWGVRKKGILAITEE